MSVIDVPAHQFDVDACVKAMDAIPDLIPFDLVQLRGIEQRRVAIAADLMFDRVIAIGEQVRGNLDFILSSRETVIQLTSFYVLAKVAVHCRNHWAAAPRRWGDMRAAKRTAAWTIERAAQVEPLLSAPARPTRGQRIH